ncbi:hypothetical protein SAMN05421780_101349 [Flexibacter flexilis DSM 6793]|uniref:Lipoprotein n=1 Tax=Flexibacter flexilis DSM 6793 TaxID=927664 RepID=A0A1I1DUJ1_9BACT|nr:hypothetical protein [Flexibacter flexilis]SFB76370.1 hypothetical protein SAMN05421780_101349 [Flexibacter flexilis DSM 6793]
MKKLLLAALSLLVGTVIVVSCSQENIEPKQAIPQKTIESKNFKVNSNSIYFKIFNNSIQSHIDTKRFGSFNLDQMFVVNQNINGKEGFILNIPLKNNTNTSKVSGENLESLTATNLVILMDTLYTDKVITLIEQSNILEMKDGLPSHMQRFLYTYDSKIIGGGETLGKDSTIYYETDSTIVYYNEDGTTFRPTGFNKCYKQQVDECAEIAVCDVYCTFNILCKPTFVMVCALQSFWSSIGFTS